MRYLYTFLMVLVFLSSLDQAVHGQALENQKLVKYDHRTWSIETAAASFEGVAPSGSIRRATVLTEQSDLVRVEVEYRGFKDAVLKGEVLDRKKRVIAGIQTQRVRLDGSPAVFTFQFATLSEAAQSESAYLKLTFSNMESAKRGFIGGFRLPKRWHHGTSSMNVQVSRSVTIVPAPIGAAKQMQEGQRILTGARGQQNSKSPGQVKGNIRVRQISDPSVEGSEGEDSTTPRGPGAIAFSLQETVQSDVDFESFHSILPIHPEIFVDQNEKAGMYYYLPAMYRLKWNSNKGFFLTMLHNKGTDQNAGDVRVHATLTPGIGTEDLETITRLVQAYSHQRGTPFEGVRPLPLDEAPVASIAGELGRQFEIPVDRISTVQSSSFFEPLQLSWSTDVQTKEEMKTALISRLGISGTMVLIPKADSVSHRQVPVTINPADRRTFGPMVLNQKSWRNQEWKNPTPYPLRLRYMHALVSNDKNGRMEPTIYSWDLRSTRVEPGQAVAIDHRGIPSWIDRNAERIWMDYQVETCSGCDESVFRQIEQGSQLSELVSVSFETFNVLDMIEAEHIRIKVRSRFTTSEAGRTTELDPVRLTTDADPRETGPLFLPGDLAGNQPLFEYFLVLVMPDGTHFEAQDWVVSREREVLLGPKQIKEAFGPISALDVLP